MTHSHVGSHDFTAVVPGGFVTLETKSPTKKRRIGLDTSGTSWRGPNSSYVGLRVSKENLGRAYKKKEMHHELAINLS